MDLIRSNGGRKKSTIFERMNVAQAVIIVVVLINSTIWGLVILNHILRSEADGSLEETSPYVSPWASWSVPKADSDQIIIDGDTRRWPDGLSDVEESYVYGTDWRQPDSDHDGMEDGWEVHYSMIKRTLFETLTLDPNEKDAFNNPDGDGFDADHDGYLSEDERLFNLREYTGGAEYDPETGCFVPDDPIFGGLDAKVDWREIGMRGGFHLDFEKEKVRFNSTDHFRTQYYHYRDGYVEGHWDKIRFPEITTNPSDPDTDGDGMDDGWELHFARELEEIWSGEREIIVRDPRIDDGLVLIEGGELTGSSYPVEKDPFWSLGHIDPLNPDDADLDIDLAEGIRKGENGYETVWVVYPDGISNLEEYGFGTSPLLLDTDGDSYVDPVTGECFILDDRTEALLLYMDPETLWNIDCPVSFRTFGVYPWDPDSDEDSMPDGWELMMGLNAGNHTDALKDYDQDGLCNRDEYRFRSLEGRYFTTHPKDPDTDGDGMPDGWEARNGRYMYDVESPGFRGDRLDLEVDGVFHKYTVDPMLKDAEEDNDGERMENFPLGYHHTPDGVTNLEEFTGTVPAPFSSNPNLPDSDGDGLFDGFEMKTGTHGELIGGRYITDPDIASVYYPLHYTPDSDNDYGGSIDVGQAGNISRRLDDWEEINGRTKYLLPPNGFDDDRDGIIDESEGEYLVFSPTNATNPDSDLDGWLDADELFGIDTKLIRKDSVLGTLRTDPCSVDTDADGLDDGEELDWYPSFREWLTDPNDADTDNDGVSDWEEETTDLFPLINWDRSNDPEWFREMQSMDFAWGWESWWEDFFIDRTNPTKSDTDRDGMSDGWEHRFGYVKNSRENRTLIKELLNISSDIYHYFQYCLTTMQQIPDGMKFWLVNPLISSDGHDDPDRDGLTNLEESRMGTHPLKRDTDGDGMPDGWEADPDNRYQPVFDPASRRYRWTLDPLDSNDWYLDPDHDGATFTMWGRTDSEPGRYINRTFYFPWVNLYEYISGSDADGDGFNENTTSPAPRIVSECHLGGYDSDSDGIPDGFEFFWSDPDNDTLPTGWELFFNGTLWSEPETIPYIDPGNDWTPFTTSLTGIGTRMIHEPEEMTAGRLYPDRKDTNMDGVYDCDEDFDLDGYTNHDEYRNGTGPLDPNSYPGSPGLIAEDTRKKK